MSQLSIQPLERKDMPIVSGMIRSSADWYADFVADDDLDEHYVGSEWEEKNFKIRDFYLGYKNENQPVGTLSLQYFNDYAYIGYLYLDTKFVGQGFGRDFMNFAVAQAKRNGKTGLFLIAHPEAIWAIKAYEKFGFKCLGKDKETILAWNDGCLKTYHEEGFYLYTYEFEEEAIALAS